MNIVLLYVELYKDAMFKNAEAVKFTFIPLHLTVVAR